MKLMKKLAKLAIRPKLRDFFKVGAEEVVKENVKRANFHNPQKPKSDWQFIFFGVVSNIIIAFGIMQYYLKRCTFD